ncbi:group III truncated hemoglobin [Enterovirga aerilata]|uniref:Group III truncated hemoglobin n=1 Tax=Enterovirga aerilata TaxID=2730920 RepID=A0A849IDE0_9HYPH|nr:group III truncated hemoglobin [Enterovirga sp. DB1703]NNM74060.1 group III truncated hemoglobin [Enterovirga sp. DB1703]
MQDIRPRGLNDRAPLDEASLAVLLDRFYAKARRDPALGPVFAGAIAEAAWPEHMARIAGFWRSVLFKTGDYKGNPFGAHLRLPGLTPALFARWLALFGETCREVLEPEAAAALQERAERIAESLQAGLFFLPGRVA